jgi:hypothetical protein
MLSILCVKNRKNKNNMHFRLEELQQKPSNGILDGGQKFTGQFKNQIFVNIGLYTV